MRDYLSSSSSNKCSMSITARGRSRFILITSNGSSATCLLAWSTYEYRVLKSWRFLHSMLYGKSFRLVCEVSLMSAPLSDMREVLISSLPNTGYNLIMRSLTMFWRYRPFAFLEFGFNRAPFLLF